MFTFPVGFFNLIASGGGGGTTDPFAANVVLFLKGDGTNGSTNIVDSSPNPKTISVFGTAQISTTQSKYGGSSLLFDGNGDYLSIPATGDMLFSSQNFTWEAWIYPTILSAPYRITLMGNARASAGGDFGMHLQVKKNATNQTMFSAWANENGSIGSTLNLNQWNHIACTRVGTTVEIFVNGIKGTTGSCATSITSHTAFLIGTVFDNSGYANDYTGYIDSLRLTAAARYTANFNPETDTYLDIPTPTPTDPNFANRLLLLHGDGANNSTIFTDSSSFNRTLTASGATVISTIASQFGESSISFNGSSRLLVASSGGLILGSSNFTLEGFIRPNSYSGFPTLFENRDAFAVRGYSCFFDGSGFLYFYASNGSSWVVTMATSVAVATGVFTYFKITRNGSNWSISLNGTVRATQTSTLSIVGEAASAFTIGGTVNGGQYNGYLDEFRVSNIYEASASIPTSPFP